MLLVLVASGGMPIATASAGTCCDECEAVSVGDSAADAERRLTDAISGRDASRGAPGAFAVAVPLPLLLWSG